MNRVLLNKQYFNTIIPISTQQENVTEHDYRRAQLFSPLTTLLLRTVITLFYIPIPILIHISVIPHLLITGNGVKICDTFEWQRSFVVLVVEYNTREWHNAHKQFPSSNTKNERSHFGNVSLSINTFIVIPY